jgi:glycosyltransferase involved in cell wall biosynthesis
VEQETWGFYGKIRYDNLAAFGFALSEIGYDDASEICPMIKTPAVSIIIPCYNGANFLLFSIKSALMQTYPAAEIIVVDDGSNDQTLEIAKAIPGIHVISQSHSGPSAARNTALRQANGEYVVFLDVDDILLPEALEHGQKALTEKTGCGFVYGYSDYIAADGSHLSTPYVPKVKDNFYRRLLQQNFIQISGAMFRRSAVDHFRTEVDGCEDWDLYLRIARRSDIFCHGNIVSQYRRHAGNSSNRKERMARSALCVLQDQLQDVSGDMQLERLCRKGIYACMRDMSGRRNVRRDWNNVVHAASHHLLKLLAPSTL